MKARGGRELGLVLLALTVAACATPTTSEPSLYSGYWNREKETMPPGPREQYQARWLGELVEHAWEHAPGVRRRLEKAGLAPRGLRRPADLVKLPVIKKRAPKR